MGKVREGGEWEAGEGWGSENERRGSRKRKGARMELQIEEVRGKQRENGKRGEELKRMEWWKREAKT